MSTSSSKNLRFGTTKTRTGCLTCKKRRLKCGEERPSCLRCRKSCRECIWLPTTIGSKVVCYQPPATFPGLSSKERHAFDFFVLNTSCQLMGTWRVSAWLAPIFQRAAAEPAIQRVGIALGALHEHHIQGSRERRHYALTQYAKAITLVRDSIQWQVEKSREVLLLACIFFCAWEALS